MIASGPKGCPDEPGFGNTSGDKVVAILESQDLHFVSTALRGDSGRCGVGRRKLDGEVVGGCSRGVKEPLLVRLWRKRQACILGAGEQMGDLIEAIDTAAADVRFESLDFTVGEVLNLHSSGELLIQPEFQRLFRWDLEQRSRLVESLLLGLPIPQIVLFQNDKGVLELIDGLQRLSSLIHFIDFKLLTNKDPDENKSPLRLVGCDIANDLNGQSYDDFPAVLQLELKRKAIRAVIIRRTNLEYLRYEMFKRLNSGGSPAEYQEVRNAQVRILGESGIEFLSFLSKCTEDANFGETTVTISDTSKERGGLQELVLRYFACKNYLDQYKGSVVDWLDDYIEAILVRKEVTFDYDSELQQLADLFGELRTRLGAGAFVKYREGRPIGGLAPAYFEAVTMGVMASYAAFKALDAAEATKRLAAVVESPDFRAVTGPGANSLPKLRRRIELIRDAYADAQNV